MKDQQKNPGGRPARISRQDIIAEARKIPAKELSLSLIARRLDVKTPSLYNHFESREALLLALSTELAADLKVRAPDPRHWRKWMAATARDLYEFYVDNPVILEMESAQQAANVVIPVIEAAMETLQGAGFEPIDALLVWSAVAGTAIFQAQSAQIENKYPSEKLLEANREASVRFPRVYETYVLLAKRSSNTLALELLDEVVALIAEPKSVATSQKPGKPRKG